MTIHNKISLVHSVLCDGEQQCDVVKSDQVTDGFVSRMGKRIKENPEFFDGILEQSKEKENERAAIAQTISDLSDSHGIISSIPRLQK